MREPQTPEGQRLRAQVSDSRWQDMVAEADQKAELYTEVAAHEQRTKMSWRDSLEAVSTTVCWSSFRWTKLYAERRSGELWERLLDRRIPPDRSKPEAVRIVARALRIADPDVSVETARQRLESQFGKEGKVSDSWLRRVWKEAGLERGRGGSHKTKPTAAVEVEEAEEVEEYHGGGGLALVLAAETETGAMAKLASAALEDGALRAETQVEPEEGWADDREGRDDMGRFTKSYNERVREGVPDGEADVRWSTDEAKASVRPLSKLSVLSMKPETLAARMMAMATNPMLSERRGFNGLAGPAGEWLGVLGGVAYMPATLDKTLAELGVLQVGDAMWNEHAGLWAKLSTRWSEPGPGWLQTVVYIDGTADPYWTRTFAKSGKVSRVGRVMPCLTRVVLNSGCGVPLLVETYVGTVKLRERLIPILYRLDQAIGPEADVFRLTIVDSEAGTAGTIAELHEQTEVTLITVLKGQVLKNARIHDEGPWVPYRKRDRIREVQVDLFGKGAPPEGIQVRGVEMQREGGRRPKTTLLVTNGAPENLSPLDVATRYHRRWPHQEQSFRNGRRGGGLERSHGYGGGMVSHIALESRLEKAERSVAAAESKQARALETKQSLEEGLVDAPGAVRRKALALADKSLRDAERQKARSETNKANLESMPEEIYVRDIGRDSIMTCLKLGALALVEYVLQEYFAGVRMEWRTFIEQFVALPVTVRTRSDRRVYQLHANRRQPKHMALLATALAEVNRRAIRRDGKLLVFELVGQQEAGS